MYKEINPFTSGKKGKNDLKSQPIKHARGNESLLLKSINANKNVTR